MKFAVGVLIRGARADGMSTTWEYLVLLVDAISEDAASEKAAQYARQRDSEYLTSDNINMRWKFESVHHVQPLNLMEITDGGEMFSFFLKNEEAISLLSSFDDD